MTIKTICRTDLETTGIDTSADVPVEIACAFYSLKHRCVISSASFLVDEGKTSTEAEKVHGIPSGLIIEHGESFVDAVRMMKIGPGTADVVTGWNAIDFDKRFFDRYACTPDLPWFDAMDLALPRPSTSRSLIATALAHDVGVVDAHRALSDVLTIARLFKRVQESHDLPSMIAQAMKPRVTIMVAETGYDPKRNDAARQAGFKWEPESKRWIKRVVSGEYGVFPFAVREVA